VIAALSYGIVILYLFAYNWFSLTEYDGTSDSDAFEELALGLILLAGTLVFIVPSIYYLIALV
jgi:hypothetical protein